MPPTNANAKKDLAKNVTLIKTAFRKSSSTKGRDGKGIAVAFAMARGQKKEEHKLVIDPRKRAQALLNELQKANPKMKQVCCGTLTVEKAGGKYIASLKLIKKLGNADRIMNEALRVMQLTQYKAQMAKVKEDEEVSDVSDEDLAAEAPEAEDEEELENARGSNNEDDEEEDNEDEDENEDAATNEDDNEADDEEEDEDEDEDDDRATNEDDDEADDDEEDEDEDEGNEKKAPLAAKGGAPLTPEKMETLKKLPVLYRGTHSAVTKQFEGLKSAIRKSYASESPELLAEIDKGLAQIDKAIEGFDHSIAAEMEKAHSAKDDATRRAHLQKCQELHTKNIHFLASNPMLKHIENNPFGVQVPVVKTYAMSFQQIDKHLKDMLK